MVDVVTIGESMILFQPMMDRSIQYAPLFTKTIAGAESNVAIGLTRMEKKVRWISHVGDDPFGRFLLSTLTGEGIDVSLCKVQSKENTAVYFKDIKGAYDPTVYYYRKNSAASKMKSTDIQSEWLESARHLHITGITPALGEATADMIMEVMERAKAKGMTISLDPNIRRKLWSEEKARKTIIKMIPLCDIFMPGLDECQFLFGEKSLDEYGEILLNKGPSLILLKLGEKGSIAITEEYTTKKESIKVKQIVDTIGAGDAFASGCLSVLLDVNDLKSALESPSKIKNIVKQAIERGNHLGALTVQFKGDWEELPTLKELQSMEQGEKAISR
ncbi:sugar kinase [Bacillus sp. FSL K6-3431]|uniref:sugar kinase n=1 Tax=Bacillus sp. FSL K6-3431 TaxID=2921500 RepID=UPI0030FA8A8A